MYLKRVIFSALGLTALCFVPAWAESPAAAPQNSVHVSGAWVRAAVAGQSATGAFMQLTALKAATLVSARSPSAARVEIHEMRMGGDVMHMRPMPKGLPLPAGQTVALQSGSYHLMLMQPKAALPVGSQVELTLVFKDRAGKQHTQTLKAPVLLQAAQTGNPRATAPPLHPAGAASHGHKH